MKENKFSFNDPYQYHILKDQEEEIGNKKNLDSSIETNERSFNDNWTKVEIKDYDHQM